MNKPENWIRIMGEKNKLPDLVHLKGKDEKIMYKDDMMDFIGRCLDDAVNSRYRLERVYVLAVLTSLGWAFASKVGRICFKEWDTFLEVVESKQFKNWSEYKEAFQPVNNQ